MQSQFRSDSTALTLASMVEDTWDIRINRRRMRRGMGSPLAVASLCLMLLAPFSSMAAEEAAVHLPTAPEEITLNDVRDAGVLLRYIRRQSVCIYEEAARPNVDQNSSATINDLSDIPESQLPAKILPARQEWLVFYVGTMETVIRQLGQEVSDIHKGSKELRIPEPMKQSLKPLWEQWSSQVEQLNRHLDELVPLFDDAATNTGKIRTVAVAIFDDTNRLEETRKSIFTTLQVAAKQYPNERIFIETPAK